MVILLACWIFIAMMIITISRTFLLMISDELIPYFVSSQFHILDPGLSIVLPSLPIIKIHYSYYSCLDLGCLYSIGSIFAVIFLGPLAWLLYHSSIQKFPSCIYLSKLYPIHHDKLLVII